MVAAAAKLDLRHEEMPVKQYDYNAYVFGQTGSHDVVITCLSSREYGIGAAATLATQPKSSFHAILLGFMVGISGVMHSEPNRYLQWGDRVRL